MPPDRVCRVVLDSPLPQLDRLFDYRIPDRLRGLVHPGVRVKVPLRSAGRVSGGYVVEVADGADYSGALSDVEETVSPVPVLTPEVWRLARTLADRSAGGANDILRLAIPPRQVRVEKAWLAERSAADEQDGTPAARAAPREPFTGYARDRLEKAVADHERIALSAVPRLVGLPSGVSVGCWAVTLAEAAVMTLAAGQSAIIAVPDHRDQRQVELALAGLAPDGAVVSLDARQSNASRYRSFLRCLEGPLIVVGNRSAVYAPARDLGLIALWDDGDPLFAEPLAPYVHARDAALVRQQLQGCALVFAGHTRTLEVQRLIELGWLDAVRPDPVITPWVVLTAEQSGGEATRGRIPSSAWQLASRALSEGPVLVQVARPGYSPGLACAHCGEAARCRHCDGPLTLPDRRSAGTCGWCGRLAAGWSCPQCGHAGFRSTTAGSVRTADELGRAFPGARVILSDGEHPVLEVGAEPALVIATRGAEPIPAGGYRAVLLLDGGRMLVRESLRVADDCLRWWSNAIALTARGAPAVLVGVGGLLGQTVATWTHARYAARELEDRRRLHLPPAVRIASITGAVETVTGAVEALEPGTTIDVLGPAPAGEGLVRAIVRFGYGEGTAVAQALRGAVVRNASGRRRPPGGKGAYGRSPTLRVRFDDPEIL